MTGVILAAGTGSRLRPLTDTVAKCLLPVGGRAILQRTIEHLIASDVEEILIVTGYRSDQVRQHVISRFPGLGIRFEHNPVYESTNNIYSLWLALRQVPPGGLVLLDSDIVFDRRILALLAASGHEDCLALASRRGMGEEEVKVRTRLDGSIIAIGKEIPPADAAGESIGIERFGDGAVHALLNILESMVGRHRRIELFYEAAFQRLLDKGGSMFAVDVGDFGCVEIDTLDDLERARGANV